MPQQHADSSGHNPGHRADASSSAEFLEQTEEIDSDPTAELASPEEFLDAGGVAEVGQVIADRYVVEGRLGTGGTANVLKARDLYRNGGQFDGGHIAIKTLRHELRFRAPSIARLQREFRQTRL